MRDFILWIIAACLAVIALVHVQILLHLEESIYICVGTEKEK